MRLFTKLWSTLLLLCVASVANAATEYEIDQKFTSVAALDGQLFAIVNETDAKAIYNKDNQNLAYDSYTNAVGGAAYLFKLHSLADAGIEQLENAYAIECVKADGSSQSVYGQTPIYLNSGAEGGFDGCFVLGNGSQYGTDVLYGGAWEIEYDTTNGFALKNVARGGYFAGVNPAPTGEDPIYWTFCTLKAGEEIPDPVIDEPEAPLAQGELIPDFFSICDEGGIPYGYEVKFGSENRAYPSTFTGGARIFNFGENGDFTKAIYFREGYVRYGNVKALALEADKEYTVCFNSAMWKASGATLVFSIFKEGDLENAVLTQTIDNTPDVNGSKDAVTGSTRSEIKFTPEEDGNYILEWNADGWKEVLLANVAVKVAAEEQGGEEPEPEPEPFTTIQPGYYLLYNVGAGQFLTQGNGWGTQASITESAKSKTLIVKLVAEGNNFKIETYANGNGLEHLSGGTVYTDQSRNKVSSWTFSQVSEDGEIYNIISADNHGGGAGAYLTASSENTIVGPGEDGTSAYAQWKLISYTGNDNTALIESMASATEENPVDATNLIANADFSYSTEFQSSWTMEAGNKNLCGGDASNPCAESWRSSFTLSQALTVPNGIYELTAQAALTDYTEAYDGTDYPVVYANEETLPFNAMEEGDRGTSMSQLSSSFTAGKYAVGPITVKVIDGKLTVGVKGTRNDTWCIWDNFQLTYYGSESVDALTPKIAELLAEAEPLQSDKSISDAAKSALAAAIEAAGAEMTTAEECYTAISALVEAIAQAKQVIEETNAAYDKAIATIKDGESYRIFTEIGETKYFLDENGYISDDASKAATFILNKVEAEGTYYTTGWDLGCKFTNPDTGGQTTFTNDGHIHAGDQNRTDWERQVFFMNEEGLFAVRATNANNVAWGSNTYWDVFTQEESLPEAGYSLEPSYVWQLAGHIDLTDLDVVIDKLQAQIAATETYDDPNNIVETVNGQLEALKTADYANRKDVEAAIAQVTVIAKSFFNGIKAKASIDITDWFIVNPSAQASQAMADGWEGTQFGDGSNGVSEYWNKAAAGFHQTISLPAGNYKLTAIALQRTDMTGYIYAGENQETIVQVGSDVANSRAQASDWFAAGNGVNEVLFTMDEAGEITIGLQADADHGDHWTVWQSFKLEKAIAPVPAGDTYAGIIMQSLSHPQHGVIGESTSDQTVTITEAGEGLVNITFSGFTLPAMPLSFDEFTVENVAVTSLQGVTVYLADDFQVSTGGQMPAPYNGTLIGAQETAESTPVIKLILQNATTDVCYFGANEEDINRFKERETANNDYSFTVERYAGMGYTPTEAAIDDETFAEIKTVLGVEELTTDMLSFVNPNGTEISYADYMTANYDGWCDAEGTATNWGDNTAICVKFFEALSEGKYSICDMNGADEIGKEYKVTWKLTNGNNSVTYTTVVKFVEAPEVQMTISENVIKASVIYTTDEASYVEKSVELTQEQISAICDELGVESIEGLDVYGYNPSNAELLTNYAGFDGWRDANGDFHNWTGSDAAPACVKFTDGKTFLCYNISGCEPQTIKCYWAIATESKAVLIEISFTYQYPDGINGIAADVENGNVFNIAGQKTGRVQKGVNIIGGKKVYVK